MGFWKKGVAGVAASVQRQGSKLLGFWKKGVAGVAASVQRPGFEIIGILEVEKMSGYRRGAVLGLTVAETFILLTFLLIVALLGLIQRGRTAPGAG